MSANTINVTKGAKEENKVLDESTFYIPREGFEGKAVQSNVRDDNEEMAKEIDEAIGYETFEDEASYESPSEEKIVNIEAFRDQERLSEIIKRAKAQKIGATTLRLFRKAA
ncbi:hypothetical protein IJ380_03125 [Candidatus Saccharibacteria bacterium]|nr:hypothetical protein [Candidatus Saccharibacteria bacterium]